MGWARESDAMGVLATGIVPVLLNLVGQVEYHFVQLGHGASGIGTGRQQECPPLLLVAF